MTGSSFAPTMLSGPYLHAGDTVGGTMSLVMLCLAPATVFGLVQFGWPSLFLFLVTVASAALFEAMCLVLAGKPVWGTLRDGSAVLTGWLLAMTLPPWAPWWIGVVGSGFAIIVAKQVFGGLGQNLFNPAMVARVVLLISFPLEMTRWLVPTGMLSSAGAPGFMDSLRLTFLGAGDMAVRADALSGASVLGHIATEGTRGVSVADALAGQFEITDMVFGTMPGSLGETSALLLLIGGLALIWFKIIRWAIPLSMLASLAVLAAISNAVAPDLYPGPIVHLMAGATMLGAFFIATDYVTCPATPLGQIWFGAGIGVLTFVIRLWADYPEGMAFAVLVMNAFVPLIDRWTRPRIFGRTPSGEVQKINAEASRP